MGVGYNALNATTRGVDNTAVGFSALELNTTGAENTAVGTSALAINTTGGTNTAIGVRALAANTTGNDNVAIGVDTLAIDHNGSDNIAIGSNALAENSEGGRNIAIGTDAFSENNGGSEGVAIGFGALSAEQGLSLRDRNVAVGYRAGGLLEAGTGNIYIGSQVFGRKAESFTTRIGVNQYKVVISGIFDNEDNCDDSTTPGSPTACGTHEVRINADGVLTTFNSSRRFKEDISELGDVSQKVLALRPVDFRRKGQPSREIRHREVGLIAEEVAAVFPQLALYDKDGKPNSVDFNAVAAVALNEVQRLHRLLEKQQSEIALLRAQLPAIAELTARLERLEASQLQLAAY